jgi:GNAT superfamily N-acetyltransferase
MNCEYRAASIDDLPNIVRMLADDFLGQQRELLEDPLPENYVKAFREIEGDPNNELIVAVISDADASDADRSVRAPANIPVGTMQLTFTPSISFQGGRRCTVESVRVDDKYRGKGIGREMMLWAIERAKEKGCISMQLTTNKDRTDAHRFYANLGFASSHLGMKLKLK